MGPVAGENSWHRWSSSTDQSKPLVSVSTATRPAVRNDAVTPSGRSPLMSMGSMAGTLLDCADQARINRSLRRRHTGRREAESDREKPSHYR